MGKVVLVLPPHGWLKEVVVDLRKRPAPTVLSLGFGSFGYWVGDHLPLPPPEMLVGEPPDSPALEKNS